MSVRLYKSPTWGRPCTLEHLGMCVEQAPQELIDALPVEEASLRRELHILGLPRDFVWPADETVNHRLVHSALSTGKIPSVVTSGIPIQLPERSRTHYRAVELCYDQWSKQVKFQFYAFINRNDWWPNEYPDHFLVHDEDTALMYLWADCGRIDPTARQYIPKELADSRISRGSEADQYPTKGAKSIRYQLWLKACAEYRSELKAARIAYLELKARGAPKLDEL